MKKSFWLIMLVFLFLTGCNIEQNGNNNTEEYKTWIVNSVNTQTDQDLDLPTTNPVYGGVITWISLDPEVISNEGVIQISAGIEDALLQYQVVLDKSTFIDYITVTVNKDTIETISTQFAEQFSVVILRDFNIKTDLNPLFNITWSSSNTEVFTNEGKYIKPLLDVDLEINYSIEYKDQKEDFTLEVTARGHSLLEKSNNIKDWIIENYLPNRLISGAVDLPDYNEMYNVDLVWESSNSGVISTDGKVTRYPFDRYVTLVLYFEIDGVMNEAEFALVVEADETMTKEEQLNSFLNAIAVPSLSQLRFTAYTDINQSFNYLPLFANNAPTVFDEKMMPVGGSRPGTKLTSLEFITIHDTANNNAGAAAHQNLLYGGFSASWHYATDQTGNYQSIPIDEVAYHAGDGSRTFKLNKTNVIATTRYPVLTISESGMYEFNGVESNIAAPLVGSRIAKTSDIAPSGIYTEVGSDGYYYINSTYYSTSFGKISNQGGNRNSVGIETAVHRGNDYAQTLRHTAEIVAEILIDNDLSVDRVLQHNNFSGKDCPNAIRHYGYWNNFLDLISLEKFGREHLSDVTFTWTSNSPLMTNHGRISLDAKATDVLNYSVVASYESTTISKDFQTVLK